MSKEARTARHLLNHQSTGVLSTHSVDLEGYPFGSITPFVIAHDGAPAILISEIAQHTRNIKQNNKVSLTVFDARAADPQAAARLTWIGDAQPVGPNDRSTRDRYLRYFPSSESYFDTHDFSFYRIELRRARFIGGFGEIHWIESNDLLLGNPFRDREPGIIEHMNNDHVAALINYSRLVGEIDADRVVMTGIDSEGFDFSVDGRKRRIDFPEPIGTVEQARAELVRLARMVS